MPDDIGLLDILARRLDRVGRGGGRRARPGRRLAQRRADRARRPGRPALRSSTPTGSRSSSRLPVARRERRWLAAASSTRASTSPDDIAVESDEAPRGRRADLSRRGRARSSSWRRAGRPARRQAGGRHDRTPNASGWRTPAIPRTAGARPARGTSGGRISPSAPGAASARTTRAGGDAWSSFPHDHARSRAYRWNEDGMAGMTDVFNRLSLALALWNGRDPILKERMFGLTGPEGNHGEDVKDYWWYLDARPEQRLAALALPLPAGRRSRTRTWSRTNARAVQARARVRAASTPASSTTTATGSSRSTTRRRPRPTS